MISPSREIPWPYMISNSASRNGGATLFFTTLTRVKVVKNKIAPPFREALFDILYGEGISREGEIIELASSLGIVEKSGSWYAYKGNRIGQGKDNTRAYLQTNKEVAREIEEQVRLRLLPPRQQRAAEPAADTA